MRPARRLAMAIALALVALGTWQVASGAWIHAKALLAQRLIAAAWQPALQGAAARRPWPWADMRPLARLTVPRHGIDLVVLDDASLRTLAFGPAHVPGTAAPGSGGNSVIVGHRDTHFAFLRELQAGDAIDIQGAGGAATRYHVREVAIVDQGESRVLDPADRAQLTLITCFPFETLRARTRQRYVVIAERAA